MRQSLVVLKFILGCLILVHSIHMDDNNNDNPLIDTFNWGMQGKHVLTRRHMMNNNAKGKIDGGGNPHNNHSGTAQPNNNNNGVTTQPPNTKGKSPKRTTTTPSEAIISPTCSSSNSLSMLVSASPSPSSSIEKTVHSNAYLNKNLSGLGTHQTEGGVLEPVLRLVVNVPRRMAWESEQDVSNDQDNLSISPTEDVKLRLGQDDCEPQGILPSGNIPSSDVMSTVVGDGTTLALDFLYTTKCSFKREIRGPVELFSGWLAITRSRNTTWFGLSQPQSFSTPVGFQVALLRAVGLPTDVVTSCVPQYSPGCVQPLAVISSALAIGVDDQQTGVRRLHLLDNWTSGSVDKHYTLQIEYRRSKAISGTRLRTPDPVIMTPTGMDDNWLHVTTSLQHVDCKQRSQVIQDKHVVVCNGVNTQFPCDADGSVLWFDEIEFRITIDSEVCDISVNAVETNGTVNFRSKPLDVISNSVTVRVGMIYIILLCVMIAMTIIWMINTYRKRKKTYTTTTNVRTVVD